ncbi:MAG TPA: hypothetical protein VMJ64_13595 [Anaerolineales bacterium]|nr:hypothetical protein [Anaerolineales bacterium]
MTWRRYAPLALLGFLLAFGIAQFQRFPGYLDSDYYFGGGIQLAIGKGFTEPYLWNYLDNPTALPHPSHSYWMPLSSVIAAAGLWLARSTSYAWGRLGFLLLAGMVPVLTAKLAFDFTRRSDLAMTAGLLGVFTVYYAPFLPVTDNYGPYLVLGACFFLTMGWSNPVSYLLLGAISGLLTLARSDGLLWFGMAIAVAGIRWLRHRSVRTALTGMLLAGAGFLLVTGPWFWHTYHVYGTLLAPGGSHLLWLKSYDETFVYPAAQLTSRSWLAQGWEPILATRLMAFQWNSLNAFAAQAAIFLLPFIFIGIWMCRKDERVIIALLGWSSLFLTMTLIFPFAGARGGFFHAGAGFQPMWWTLAPVGLDRTIAAARKRGMFTPQASKVFQAALVGLVVLMTGVILWIRVLPGWGEGEQDYPKVESFLKQHGVADGDIVMVRNPPGYYLMTGRPAIVVPDGDEVTMSAVADRYGAKFLVIEDAGAAGPIRDVYNNLNSTRFTYLGNVDGTHIFRVVQ